VEGEWAGCWEVSAVWDSKGLLLCSSKEVLFHIVRTPSRSQRDDIKSMDDNEKRSQ
jgi:hypothetical protein